MKYFFIGLLVLMLAACSTKPTLLEQSNAYAVTIGDYCSGQFIDNKADLIATAAHCTKTDTEANIPIFRRVFDAEGEEIAKYQYTAKVVARDEEHDIAILELTFGDFTLTPVEISYEPVKYGDLVFTVGNPYMFYRTISTGKVVKPDAGNNRILMDAFMAPGSSGGALLDSKGRLIGLTNWGISSPMNPIIGGAASVKWLKKLLETIE